MTAPAPAAAVPTVESVWRPAVPVDVRRTLAPLCRGPGDPTFTVSADGALWRTTLLPSGATTYRLAQRGLHEVHATAWGAGAEELVAGLPDLLGARDTAERFEPRHSLLVEAAARVPGLRIPRTGRVVEALVPAVLEQKVTGRQARAAFARLVRRFGAPAPGPAPAGMRVPPAAEVWRAVPSWEWHRAGVEPARSRTICAAMRVVARLEECATLPLEEATARLCAVPGIGPWTAAEVSQRALGDADALSVGDYHLSAFVGWLLVGRPLDDEQMVELLEPDRPHRYRVIRLLECSGRTAPRFGPRLTVQDHRAH